MTEKSEQVEEKQIGIRPVYKDLYLPSISISKNHPILEFSHLKTIPHLSGSSNKNCSSTHLPQLGVPRFFSNDIIYRSYFLNNPEGTEQNNEEEIPRDLSLFLIF